MRQAKTKQIAQTIQNKRRKSLIKAGYFNLALKSIVLILVGYLIFSQIFLIGQVKGMDMFPAVKDGDLMIAFRLHKGYEKDDLVSYKQDGQRKIGRVVASSEDIVDIDEEGNFRVNGTLQTGEILFPTYPKEKLSYPYQLEENDVFILGDYRNQAKDSRDYGPISVEHIEGKIITILRQQGL